jgi:serine/threonine-protein kinase
MESVPASLSVRFAGRYTVERELGCGATSTVYLARDETLDRLVALKVLRRELAESIAADRFLREIKLNEGLSHPRIAPVLDSGEEGDKLFFVLPYKDSFHSTPQLRSLGRSPRHWSTRTDLVWSTGM